MDQSIQQSQRLVNLVDHSDGLTVLKLKRCPWYITTGENGMLQLSARYWCIRCKTPSANYQSTCPSCFLKY